MRISPHLLPQSLLPIGNLPRPQQVTLGNPHPPQGLPTLTINRTIHRITSLPKCHLNTVQQILLRILIKLLLGAPFCNAILQSSTLGLPTQYIPKMCPTINSIGPLLHATLMSAPQHPCPRTIVMLALIPRSLMTGHTYLLTTTMIDMGTTVSLTNHSLTINIGQVHNRIWFLPLLQDNLTRNITRSQMWEEGIKEGVSIHHRDCIVIVNSREIEEGLEKVVLLGKWGRVALHESPVLHGMVILDWRGILVLLIPEISGIPDMKLFLNPVKDLTTEKKISYSELYFCFAIYIRILVFIFIDMYSWKWYMAFLIHIWFKITVTKINGVIHDQCWLHWPQF